MKGQTVVVRASYYIDKCLSTYVLNVKNVSRCTTCKAWYIRATYLRIESVQRNHANRKLKQHTLTQSSIDSSNNHGDPAM